jgi:PAS domain S-box-containing protein
MYDKLRSDIENKRNEINNKSNKIESLMAHISEKDNEIRIMKETLELIIESSTEGFWDWNIVDDYEYLSPTFKKHFGYEEHEMENHPSSWQNIINKDDLPNILENFDKHIESKGKIPFANECRYTHKDGHEVLIWCKGKVVEWGVDGSPIRMVGTHVDITNLKK